MVFNRKPVSHSQHNRLVGSVKLKQLLGGVGCLTGSLTESRGSLWVPRVLFNKSFSKRSWEISPALTLLPLIDTHTRHSQTPGIHRHQAFTDTRHSQIRWEEKIKPRIWWKKNKIMTTWPFIKQKNKDIWIILHQTKVLRVPMLIGHFTLEIGEILEITFTIPSIK